MATPPAIQDAARCLARALVGEDPAPEEAARFEQAVRLRAPVLGSARDHALWRLAMRGPQWTRLVDAGLAIADPWSPVRLRVCLMLAILEASPHHVRRFLPEPWSPWTPPALLARAALAAARAALGLVLVRSHGVLWW